MLVEVKQTAKIVRISQGFLVLIAYGKWNRWNCYILKCAEKKLFYAKKDVIFVTSEKSTIKLRVSYIAEKYKTIFVRSSVINANKYIIAQNKIINVSRVPR